MKTFLGHVEVKVAGANTSFYKELLQFLGWNTIWEGEGMLGLGGSEGASLWFTEAANSAKNDYDSPGVNHLGISAAAQSDIDATAAYLRGKGVPLLFETPRHRPEFASSADETYYQVMFESPDRVLFEVVYTGPKQ